MRRDEGRNRSSRLSHCQARVWALPPNIKCPSKSPFVFPSIHPVASTHPLLSSTCHQPLFHPRRTQRTHLSTVPRSQSRTTPSAPPAQPTTPRSNAVPNAKVRLLGILDKVHPSRVPRRSPIARMLPLFPAPGQEHRRPLPTPLHACTAQRREPSKGVFALHPLQPQGRVVNLPLALQLQKALSKSAASGNLSAMYAGSTVRIPNTVSSLRLS